jgi:LPS-assembly protein
MGARFCRNPPVRRTHLRLLPLCLAIAGAVRAEETAAPTWALCPNPATLPIFTQLPDVSGTARETAPTDITGDDLNVQKSDSTTFSGNVELIHADQWMATDKVTYTHEAEQFVTEGQVRYQDKGVRLTATKATGDQKADTLQLEGVNYQFNDELGNGTAKRAVMHGQIGTLTDATYSTCPPGQRQWEFQASSIVVDDAKAKGVARNATLRIGKIPVLWLPVVSFPTDDRRRTGALAPTLGRDDRNGLDLKLPVYFNLAPNYDATLAPHYYSKRGLMLEGEFRYLTGRSHGQFNGTYLPGDDLGYNDPFNPLAGTDHPDRSNLSFRDTTTINQHWYFSTDLNSVSDQLYFSDFGDSIDFTSISLLNSNAGVYGRGKYWTASLSAETWQIASPLLRDGDEPYRRLPRLQAWGHRPFGRHVEAGVGFEAVRFDHENFAELPANFARYDSGNRIDIMPWLRFPFGGSAWYVTPQVAWRYTGYDSLEGRLVDSGARPDSASRSLPIASLDAGATFERTMDWGGHQYVQTLEPRLYYLYTPYRDQDELPLFDTRELTFGWTSLFRENRFGGGDRQADANQLALALTTRILSAADGREKLSAGIGRITYFDAPRVLLTRSCEPVLTPGCTNPSAPLTNEDGSDWVANIDWAVRDWWRVGVTQQWDPDGQRTDLSSVRTQFRWANGGLLNAAYRFRRDLPNQPALEQTDLSFVIPVNTSWNLYGRWNYSLHDEQTIEALAGFEWNSCCVAVRVLGRQYIRSFDSRQNLGLYVEIELNGLGSFGRDTTRLLDNAILGYGH